MTVLTQEEYDTLLPHASTFLEGEHEEIFTYNANEVHEVTVFLTDKGVRWKMENESVKTHNTYNVMAPTITKDEFLREQFQDFLTENLVPKMGDTYRFYLFDYIYTNEFYVNPMCFAYETGFLSYSGAY